MSPGSMPFLISVSFCNARFFTLASCLASALALAQASAFAFAVCDYRLLAAPVRGVVLPDSTGAAANSAANPAAHLAASATATRNADHLCVFDVALSIVLALPFGNVCASAASAASATLAVTVACASLAAIATLAKAPGFATCRHSAALVCFCLFAFRPHSPPSGLNFLQ